MRRSQSMENLPMLPEEAKMAASLLRLTLSDKQETSTESEFQSYMSKHSHFPYHKAVPIAIVHENSESYPFRSSVSDAKVTSHHLASIQIANRKRENMISRRRCESSPCAISSDQVKIIDSRLSQSAPAESEGFFQRLLPSFLRRKVSNTGKKNGSACPVVVKPAPAPVQKNPKSADRLETNEPGRFVLEFTRNSRNNNLDNLIFMSMR